MRGKAYRRFQQYKRINHFVRFSYDKPDDRLIGIFAKTPAKCSCHMCGNPRKHWKELTIQERRHI